MRIYIFSSLRGGSYTARNGNWLFYYDDNDDNDDDDDNNNTNSVKDNQDNGNHNKDYHNIDNRKLLVITFFLPKKIPLKYLISEEPHDFIKSPL